MQIHHKLLRYNRPNRKSRAREHCQGGQLRYNLGLEHASMIFGLLRPSAIFNPGGDEW